MRRILRKIAEGARSMSESGQDISTLADPAVVEDLVRKNAKHK